MQLGWQIFRGRDYAWPPDTKRRTAGANEGRRLVLISVVLGPPEIQRNEDRKSNALLPGPHLGIACIIYDPTPHTLAVLYISIAVSSAFSYFIRFARYSTFPSF